MWVSQYDANKQENKHKNKQTKTNKQTNNFVNQKYLIHLSTESMKELTLAIAKHSIFHRNVWKYLHIAHSTSPIYVQIARLSQLDKIHIIDGVLSRL